MVRKMVIAVALAAGFFGVQSPAWAGLKFKNNTSETVWIAIAHTKDGVLFAEGWWEIKPRATLEVISGNLHHRYYYVYAHTASERTYWMGDYYFWIHPTNTFTIKDVNGSTKPKGAKQVGFARIDTGAKARDFTLNLRTATTGGIID